jgi:hypothetical protein
MSGIILLKAHVRTKPTEYGDREILWIVINVHSEIKISQYKTTIAIELCWALSIQCLFEIIPKS